MKAMVSVEQSFAFGRYRLFVRRRELFADDAAVPVGSRAFDILAVLVEAGGNIVSKDEIMRRVWGNILVEENTLQSQVHALRRALGPDRGLVANVSGRGYRIAINVRMLDGDNADGPSPDRKDIDRGAEEGTVNAGHTLTNVRAPVSPLIDRSRELEMMLSLIQARRLVTITGIGGIGKTRLAMEVGRASALRFPDGVWLADLAQVRESDLLGATVITSTGLRPQSSDITPEDVAAALASKRVLLILDTCEHLGDVVGSFAQRLVQGAPYLNVLATSRQPLGAEGEQVYQIPPLGTPDGLVPRADEVLRCAAAQLFEARIKELDPEFCVTDGNAGSVTRICRRLDGIPLAIELAAPRVAALGPETIANRLDQLFELLSRGRATAPKRHHTLRATLDWSYEPLPEDERAIFRRLAVFSGGFSLEAVCAVVNDATCSESNVVDRLDRLIAKSLVIIDQRDVPRRFRLLHPVADYAMEKLTECGEVQELRRRHAQFYLKAVSGAARGRWG
jgi:predicted ATPase/DNA-binding winged helix-turn-helix (wHTH) protein